MVTGQSFDDDEEILKPVLGAKDVPGTSPPSDASTFTTTNTSSKTKRRTSLDESRGRWDMNGDDEYYGELGVPRSSWRFFGRQVNE